MNDFDGELEHHGVKGMKWGEHHATSTEIHDARARTHLRFSQIEDHANAISKTNSSVEKQKHINEIHRLANEGLNSGDIEKGGTSTRAEKLISTGAGLGVGSLATLGTPLGTAAGGAGGLTLQQAFRAHQRHHNTQMFTSYAHSTVGDFDHPQ